MKLFSFIKNYRSNNAIKDTRKECSTERSYEVVHIEAEAKIIFIQPVKKRPPQRSLFKKIISPLLSLFR
jgi:hypothetical protein